MFRSYDNVPRPAMSLDEIRKVAPSVFATEPHNAVSQEYKFIPTIEIMQTLMGQGWLPVQAGEHRVRNASKLGYQKHLLRFRHPNIPKIGDSEVDLLCYNSHDRTSAFKFLAGLYRFVCANGMACGEDLFEPIAVKHIGYKADNCIDAAYRIVENVPLIASSVEAMRSIDLDTHERVAFASAALVAKYGKDDGGRVLSPIAPDQMLKSRRREDIGTDLWTTFNVVQENAIRGGQLTYRQDIHGRVRRTSARKVESISQSTKLNQALWTLAEQMKAHKLGSAA